MKKFAQRDVLIELLKMRQLSDEQAAIATDFFAELIGDGTFVWPQERVMAAAESTPQKEETLNDFIRELLERVLLLPVQMFLDRLPDDQRERLKKRIVL